MSERTLLLIIDPQKDFMDDEDSTLPVPGANADMDRLANFIQAYYGRVDDVIISLDTHSPDHIAQAIRWVGVEGICPASFTVITADDVRTGTWKAANPADQDWQLQYVSELEHTAGKPLVVWPPHCELGTPGHAIQARLYEHLLFWMTMNKKFFSIMEKGYHRDTEQYGAFGADVPIKAVPETCLNFETIGRINRYDRVLVAGEALSHCVATSVDQIFRVIPRSDCAKYTLLRDCTSPVQGFEEEAGAWLVSATTRGMQVATTGSRIW